MDNLISHGRETSDDRRKEIARAARELIIEKGFEGLRTRDIAERVGINIATLHYHVPNKQALVALVAHSMEVDFAEQSRRRPRAHLPPLEQLRVEFEDFRESMAETPDVAILMFELLGRARRDPEIDAVMRPMYQHWTASLAAILAKGIADGSFRPDLDPEAGALLLSCAMSDFWRRFGLDLPAFDRLAAELERAVINPQSPVQGPLP